jgi:hypothetical protein
MVLLCADDYRHLGHIRIGEDTVSKNREYLESKGWRLFSRRKYGMYIKELWYHPRDGSVVFNQEQAVREQRMFDRTKEGKK